MTEDVDAQGDELIFFPVKDWIEVIKTLLRPENIGIKKSTSRKQHKLRQRLTSSSSEFELREEMDPSKDPQARKLKDSDEHSSEHSMKEGEKEVNEGKISEEAQSEADIEIPVSSKPSETVLEPKAYLKMVLHAAKYAGPQLPRKKWVEVIGLLTGIVENKDTPLERIVVKDAFPIGHGDAISVVIQNPGSMERVYREKQGTDFIVGWYHSHPSYGHFMSEEDRKTQLRYQTLWADSIAIVLDPTQISQSSYGFEIFRLKRPGLVRWEQLPYIVRDLSPAPLPELVEFLRPLIGGDALFLEYE
ncbi:MAG: hypothetical protein ACE5OZ_07685 [Candidatus Heimdallarchaeota archaeon]